MNFEYSVKQGIAHITEEEFARIERFIAAYNAIENELGRILNVSQTFRSSVDAFAKRNPWWGDAETLRVFAAMRNFLVHEKMSAFDYPCVPSEGAVREIEAIRDRFLRPATIGAQFTREVIVLGPRDELRSALDLIAKHGISRFPIYEGNRFFGLLTENGIARFLATVVTQNRGFDPDTHIEKVLPRETKRKSHRFAGPQIPISQAAYWFSQNTFLEAILISHDGSESRNLRGIVTRGDVAGWS
jgi:CBS domain-containing protein